MRRSIQLYAATFLATSVIILLTESAQAQVRVGGGFVYGTDVEELGLQVNGYYGLDTLAEGLRVGAEFAYYFVEDPLTLWTIDVNGQYRFFHQGQLGVYALAGLDFANSSIGGDAAEAAEALGIDTSTTEVGLNLGVGVEYAVVPNVELFGEIKYVLISELDQAVFGLGGRFLF